MQRRGRIPIVALALVLAAALGAPLAGTTGEVKLDVLKLRPKLLAELETRDAHRFPQLRPGRLDAGGDDQRRPAHRLLLGGPGRPAGVSGPGSCDRPTVFEQGRAGVLAPRRGEVRRDAP